MNEDNLIGSFVLNVNPKKIADKSKGADAKFKEQVYRVSTYLLKRNFKINSYDKVRAKITILVPEALDFGGYVNIEIRFIKV